MNFFGQHIQNFKTKDEGFTLTEFVLVSIFFVFVVILVYQLVYFVDKSTESTRRNAVMTNEIGVPLEILDRYFSQNLQLSPDIGNGLTLTMPGKRSASGVQSPDYVVRFRLTDDNKLLMVRTRSSVTETFVLSDKIANNDTSTPLFSFKDRFGNPTTDLEEADTVRIELVAYLPGDKETVTSVRTVFFRNR